MADLQTWVAVLGGVTTAVGGFGAGWMAMRRQLSKDGVELVKDRAEVDILQTVIRERDQLIGENQRTREAFIEAVRKVERLESDAVHDLETIERLERDYAKLLPYAPEEVRRVLETNFGRLGGPEVKS